MSKVCELELAYTVKNNSGVDSNNPALSTSAGHTTVEFSGVSGCASSLTNDQHTTHTDTHTVTQRADVATQFGKPYQGTQKSRSKTLERVHKHCVQAAQRCN